VSSSSDFGPWRYRSDGAYWRPDGEDNPATSSMPAYAKRRRRRVAAETTSTASGPTSEEVFVDGLVHERPQDSTSIQSRRRYARPVIGSMNAEATSRYYAARAAAARAQGHRLEGGVLGPGSFHASCECGAKLSPGELSAVTTRCRSRQAM
jgi:hypothetical protein